MHLKECSRKVVFIPTGDNVVKMSLPVSVLKQKASSEDLTTDDVWMTGVVERYRNRPNDNVFSDMCLAKFASEYHILTKNERCKNPIKLNNGFGFVTKRTQTEPAVIRSVRFSETKDPEKFHHTNIQLYLPYRLDGDLKPSSHETFEDFYKTGFVRSSNGTIQSADSLTLIRSLNE